jgi:hypothetical protein
LNPDLNISGVTWYSCAARLPIQPDRAWEDLGETPQIYVPSL